MLKVNSAILVNVQGQTVCMIDVKFV